MQLRLKVETMVLHYKVYNLLYKFQMNNLMFIHLEQLQIRNLYLQQLY